MLGAIAGDIIGSVYEFTAQKRYDFEMLPKGSRFTDDSVMTIAVAHWLSHCDEEGNTDHRRWVINTLMPDMAVHSTLGYGVRIHNLTTAGATERQCA